MLDRSKHSPGARERCNEAQNHRKRSQRIVLLKNRDVALHIHMIVEHDRAELAPKRQVLEVDLGIADDSSIWRGAAIRGVKPRPH